MNLRYPGAFRDFGFRRALHIHLMRALRALAVQLYLVQLGDDRGDIEAPTLASGYTTRPVEPRELLPWADRPGFGLTREFLELAGERGHPAVANFYGDDLVGYGFVARGRAPVTNQVDVLVSDRLVYRYKAWTHPAHRRQHLSFARGRINRTLFPLQSGQRTVSYVETHNYASRLHRPELRPRNVGYSGIIRLAGREYPFTTAGPRRAGFRLVRSR
jgi:hypothetical protein